MFKTPNYGNIVIKNSSVSITTMIKSLNSEPNVMLSISADRSFMFLTL